ncbi:protein containing Beta-ketoacyl synthase, partial [Candidatus Magnetobacterium bavaricum]
EEALVDARCQVGQLAFISPHGSATQKGDRSELNSIKALLQGHTLPICGLKPYTGHMAAASDIAETIMAIAALRQGLVPATLNYTTAERLFANLNIPVVHTPAKGKTFLSVSYGIGGQSSAVVVEAVQ